MNWAGLVTILFLGGCLLNGCGSGRSTPPPPVVTHFEVVATSGVISGAPFDVTVAALAVGDIVVTTYSGTVHFTSSDPQAVLPADSTITSGAGTFSVTLKTVGSQTIAASAAGNPSISGTSNRISVTGPATHLSVTAPSTAVAGTAFNVTVIPVDAFNNTASGYSGTVHFTSTDSHAVLPANTAQNGVGNYSATLKTLSGQTITATDTNSPSITGTSNSISVLAFAITSAPPPNGTVGHPYGGQHSVTIDHCTLTFVGHELDAAGGAGGYHWSWSAAPGSALPPGLAITVASTSCGGPPGPIGLAAEIISGTPTTAGTYNVIVTVTDSASPPAQASANYTITISAPASAAAATKEVSASDQHTRYRLVDLGTLGGPTSLFSNGNDGILNNQGTAVGWADTSAADPYAPFCFNPDCFVSHALQSQDGLLSDLSVLPGGASSNAVWVTANGLIVGTSQNGRIDPLFSGFPEMHAVIWRDGVITDLGTLADGGYESVGLTANNGGHVVGFALNTTTDPYSLAGPGFFATQTRAFLWREGAMQDLGTLGGNDAAAFFVNDRGQITGQSYTNTTPNSTTGLPTAHSFFWEKGTMLDIGSLGGTLGNPTSLNNRGQVVGISNMAGDLTSHPFLWSKKKGLQDLGTLGGDNGVANWINDTGDIAGKADLPGPSPQNHDAVLWRKNGAEMIDLGVLPGDSCANAYYVNSGGQVVGTSENSDLCRIPTGEHAFLWENGGPMIDLNTLIPPSSSLQLTFAFAINDDGQIAGIGVPSGCSPDNIDFCGHAYVLIPCDENTAGAGECDDRPVDAAALPVTHAAVRTASRQARPVALWLRSDRSESRETGPRK